MKIRANNIEMNYELSGEGECLILIHGFSDNLNMWYNQAHEFTKRCRVLTYDVRGFGQTEVAEAPYSMDLFADDLHELLEALEIKSGCVLGYSMGGRIGLEFTFKYPESVTGLIFANSGMGAPPDPEMEERRKMMAGVLQAGDNELISSIMATASFSPDFDKKDPTSFQRYKEIKLQNNPSEYYKIMQVLVEALDVPLDLGRLECPALIIAGENDGLMDLSVAESMKRSIVDSDLKILPTGHAAAIESPREFNKAVLDFMERLHGA